MQSLQIITFLSVCVSSVVSPATQPNPGWPPWVNGLDIKPKKQAKEAPHRLLLIMRTFYYDEAKRIADQNHIRAMNEATTQFETGYLLHEAIERYRIMVELTNRAMKYRMSNIMETLEKTDTIQKLWIEVWHLCMMIHEIPPKYSEPIFTEKKSLLPDGQDNVEPSIGDGTQNAEDVKNELNKIRDEAIKKRQEKKKMLKIQKKIYSKYLQHFRPNGKRIVEITQRPSSWPFDYGWEVPETFWTATENLTKWW